MAVSEPMVTRLLIKCGPCGVQHSGDVFSKLTGTSKGSGFEERRLEYFINIGFLFSVYHVGPVWMCFGKLNHEDGFNFLREITYWEEQLQF